MGRRIRQLESELSDALEATREQRARANEANSSYHRACKGWEKERELYERQRERDARAIEAFGRERDEAVAQRDEAHRIVRLLAGKLLGVGFLDEKQHVTISETRARRIMADERRPVVMHDQLTGKTVVRLVEPGNPRPWDEVPR